MAQNAIATANDNMFKHTRPERCDDSIRLIEILPGDDAEQIKCKLRHTRVGETDYVALSYEWGSPVEPRYIELNAKSFRVTSNLHDFLCTARKKGATESIWIDAICTYSDRSRIRHFRNLRFEPLF